MVPIRVAVASGKGGTGKTFISTNLSWVSGAQILDCDVEEPNVHLFLPLDLKEEVPVKVWVPRVDEARCDHCGICARSCRFNALLVLPEQVLFFEELCHGCGLCQYLCPQGAIGDGERVIGQVRLGRAGKVPYVGGVLKVGEPRAQPVIKAVKERLDPGLEAILDAPPGTSCPAVETVKGCDLCLLVVEPTPFGLEDLALSLDAFGRLGVKMAAVINRSDLGMDADGFLSERGIKVLARIPFDPEIAQAYASGKLVVEEVPRYRGIFEEIWEGVLREAR